jgi:predicted RNA-binding Zn-ribbon protein involved in translation (DUF1610 family)
MQLISDWKPVYADYEAAKLALDGYLPSDDTAGPVAQGIKKLKLAERGMADLFRRTADERNVWREKARWTEACSAGAEAINRMATEYVEQKKELEALKAPKVPQNEGGLDMLLCPACGHVAVNPAPEAHRTFNSQYYPMCRRCGEHGPECTTFTHAMEMWWKQSKEKAPK